MNNKTVENGSEALFVKFSKMEQEKPPTNFNPMYRYPMYDGSNKRDMGNMCEMGRNINRYFPISASGWMSNPLGGTHALGNFIVFICGVGPSTIEHMLRYNYMWQLCSPSFGEDCCRIANFSLDIQLF